MVGRLVEQQQVRRREQHRGQGHAHAPATGEGGERARLRRHVEAEAGEDGGRPRGGGIGADRIKAVMDVGQALGRRGLGLGEQGGALGVGGEDVFER